MFGIVLLVLFLFILVLTGTIGNFLSWLFSLAVGLVSGLFQAVWNSIILPLLSLFWKLIVAVWPFLAAAAALAAIVYVLRSLHGGNFGSSGYSGSYYSGSSYSSYSYVGNKRSKVVHWRYSDAVRDMSDRNKVYFSTRAEAEEKGYRPAKEP